MCPVTCLKDRLGTTHVVRCFIVKRPEPHDGNEDLGSLSRPDLYDGLERYVLFIIP